MHSLAEIYRRNYPNSNSFRQYYQEFLLVSRKPLRIGSDPRTNESLGKSVAEYIEYLEEKNWLVESDFAFVQQYLVDGDQYMYEKFVDHVKRFLQGVTKNRCLDL